MAKSIKSSATTGNAPTYHFIELPCPYCDHRFVALTDFRAYRLHGKTDDYSRCVCPSCGETMYVHSETKDIIDAEKFTEIGGSWNLILT